MHLAFSSGLLDSAVKEDSGETNVLSAGVEDWENGWIRFFGLPGAAGDRNGDLSTFDG